MKNIFFNELRTLRIIYDGSNIKVIEAPAFQIDVAIRLGQILRICGMRNSSNVSYFWKYNTRGA